MSVNKLSNIMYLEIKYFESIISFCGGEVKKQSYTTKSYASAYRSLRDPGGRLASGHL